MADLLGKITGGIDRGIRTISSKSKEIIEVTRLKGELKEIDATLQMKFNAVGKMVFQMINSGNLNENDISIECRKISDCYKKITAIEENIRIAESETLKAQYGFGAVVCPACGGVNKEGDRFCKICGSAITAKNKKYCSTCPSCHAIISRKAVFCGSCGRAMPNENDLSFDIASGKLCHNCGHEISIDDVFCLFCGTKL